MRTFRILTPVLATLLAAACKPAEVPGTVYGERPTLSDTTLISAILTEPDAYVGQRVLVAGTVVEVCEKRGCWMQVASDQEFQALRVKVEDGVIVFPMTARGHAAVVEGIVEKIVWNPTYQVERRTAPLAPLTAADLAPPVGPGRLLMQLGLPPGYRTTFRPDSNSLRIFVEDGTVDVDFARGKATVELVRERPVLGAFNFLHLNHPKKLWTWVADIYAVALGLLAITGLFVIRGKKGITGRGTWLTAAGIAIPFVFLWNYR
jgi:hypothetical protein